MLRSLGSIQLSFLKYWYRTYVFVRELMCACIPEWPAGVGFNIGGI